MKFGAAALALVPFLGSVSAQRPTNTSMCEYYTTALFMNNTGANQLSLLTALVNTVVIGNYSASKSGMKVPGILAPGSVNGTYVNLLPYFDGGYASTNRNGQAVAVNFLDDGGAAPLALGKPANGTNSNQYRLLTHLYQYFGALLGCTATGFPSYAGGASQYTVHKFMDLNVYQNTYFIQQVGAAAASFGVLDSDITAVATALSTLFNYRCSPATTVIPAQGAQLQAICVASSCPLAVNNTCASYDNVTMPAVANSSLVPTNTMVSTGSATGTASRTGSATGATGTSTSSAAAERFTMGAGAGLFALLAYLL